ncbi:AraC family transcriptional regulator [Niabella hibiscisoli]|uniref:AraC family transcriptional regulator n=1 Tax=Niabella hibiscisoli TaxID=1825928 RepID=UPI001F0F0779|nr:AraC family transcriptional regulator [Niabella hibiscisoli]MCH5721312.1 AraC family transcriptional regulator [Niabella hibiscisoli]MCH5721446.1 AraC family transcriptional regulator [Niabella hibiscisoli]
MKPALEHLPKERNESFAVRDFDYHYYPNPWHYHPEYEIVLVTESTGKRFIGDHLSDFEPGNLVLIGPNIPHTYRNHDRYYEKDAGLRARSIVIHFTEASLGNETLHLPETQAIQRLFEQSKRAIEVTGNTNRYVSELLYKIVGLNGLKRWICLWEIVAALAESNDLKPICNWSQEGHNPKESKRLWDVLDWAIHHFEEGITLKQAASIAQMQENAFSRFFSKRTKKTFSQFVQELRLQKAARLLIENDELSVTQICYDCGYNNLSNFNRQFLNHYEMSPVKYKRIYRS